MARNKKGTQAHTGPSRTDLMADVTVHQLMASLVAAVSVRDRRKQFYVAEVTRGVGRLRMYL